jgi:hypothetical protein
MTTRGTACWCSESSIGQTCTARADRSRIGQAQILTRGPFNPAQSAGAAVVAASNASSALVNTATQWRRPASSVCIAQPVTTAQGELDDVVGRTELIGDGAVAGHIHPGADLY